MHLPPKCVTIVFDLSWDDCDNEEIFGNNGYAKFWRVNKVEGEPYVLTVSTPTRLTTLSNTEYNVYLDYTV